MPFTVTHIAAVLPIAWVGRWRLPFSALAIGSMVPDVAGYYPELMDYPRTHSIRGIFTHCMPIGVTLYYIYQTMLKRPFFDLFPDEIRSRMRPWIERSVQFTPPAVIAVMLSVIVGAMTHVAWDSFSHFSGWGVRNYPVMKSIVGEVAGRPQRWFDVVQHGSSLLLIPMIGGFVLWVTSLSRTNTEDDRARMPPMVTGFFLIMLVVGGTIYWQHLMDINPKRDWISALAHACKDTGALTIILFLAYALGMNWLWWRDRNLILPIQSPVLASEPDQQAD